MEEKGISPFVHSVAIKGDYPMDRGRAMLLLGGLKILIFLNRVYGN